MIKKFHISEQIKCKVIEYTIRCLPNEACGFIAGIKGTAIEFLPISNELHSPSKFRMDPQEQLNAFIYLEEKGLDLLAIFHSHPNGPDHPSQTDLDEFTYPGIIYVICFPENKTLNIKAYHLDTNQYSQIQIYS